MIDIEQIPVDIRERPQWVVWRRITRGGRAAKVPYRADGAGRASSTDPKTWATFDEAVAAAKGADGIGYVFASADPFVGIDLDGGLPEADRAAIIKGLDSYTETSISGTGVHVIVKASMSGSRNRCGPFEAYDRHRYFVMTGHHVAGTPTTIESRQAELDELIARLLPEPPPPSVPRGVAPIPVEFEDEELLERAHGGRNGSDFAALWAGQWEGRYASHSEADMGLASMLAFWTGADPERIDRLFRSSGLMRGKWDERRGDSTYGSVTIAGALAGRVEFFEPQGPKSRTAGRERDDDRGRDGDDGDRVPEYDGDDDVAGCGPGCSWTPRDLTARPSRAPIVPSALGIYPSRRHLLSGEPDDGKTMLALMVGVEAIRAGGNVVFLDLDGMGEADTASRLRELGLSDEEIRTRFVYLAPDEPLTEAAARAALDRLISQRAPSLVVIDSYTAALELHGLNPDRGNEIQRLHRLMIGPLAAHDAAILLIDHLPKNKESRGGKYAIGSERKLGLVHVHLGVEVITPFGRGRTGLVKLRNKKDRLSRLARPHVCEVELRSDAETDALTWTVRATGDAEHAGTFRPTRLMERVSNYLQAQAAPPSRNDVEGSVRGNVTYLRVAMDTLVSEGYADESEGPRKSRPLTSLRPFREHDLVHDFVHPEKDDLAQPRPSTSSIEKPHEQAKNDDFVQPRPDLVHRPRTDLVHETPLPYRGGVSDGTRSSGAAADPDKPGQPPPVPESSSGSATAARDLEDLSPDEVFSLVADREERPR